MRHRGQISGGGRRVGGFSLVEILVAIAIIAILIGAMVTVADYVHTNAKIKNTENTIQFLSSALSEYREAKRGSSGTVEFPTEPYMQAELNGGSAASDVRFRECWGWLGANDFDLDSHTLPTAAWENWDSLDPAEQDELIAARASSEVLYYYLQGVPQCRELLNKLPGKATANDDLDAVRDGTNEMALMEVIDAWGYPIRYRNVTDGSGYLTGNFPILTSAGPDGLFDTADDIISSEL